MDGDDVQFCPVFASIQSYTLIIKDVEDIILLWGLVGQTRRTRLNCLTVQKPSCRTGLDEFNAQKAE
jgi:hypothetical protein